MSPFSNSSRICSLKLSQYPFSLGDPSAMDAVFAPTPARQSIRSIDERGALIQLLTASAMTSVEFRFTQIGKNSQLCSSMMSNVWNDETLSAIGPRAMVECHPQSGAERSRMTRHDCENRDVN
jgi:hypothetical protein